VLLMLVTGILFGLAPAIRTTRVDLVSPVKGGEAARGAQRYWGRNALVALQTALSVVLLVSAGLFVKSFVQATSTNPGFRIDNVLLLSLDPALVEYSQTRTQAFYQQLQDRVRDIPGVRSVTLASHVPLSPLTFEQTVSREDADLPAGQNAAVVMYNLVDAGFFETMATPILRGRTFEARDSEASPRVAIANQALVQKFWPKGDALGQRIRLRDKTGPVVEVIGIAQDAKYQDAVEQPRPYLYLPYRQEFRSRMTLFVHTAGEPTSLIPALRREVQTLGPDLPLYDVRTMKDVFESTGLLSAA
jgi:hypothetical protein